MNTKDEKRIVTLPRGLDYNVCRDYIQADRFCSNPTNKHRNGLCLICQDLTEKEIHTLNTHIRKIPFMKWRNDTIGKETPDPKEKFNKSVIYKNQTTMLHIHFETNPNAQIVLLVPASI